MLYEIYQRKKRLKHFCECYIKPLKFILTTTYTLRPSTYEDYICDTKYGAPLVNFFFLFWGSVEIIIYYEHFSFLLWFLGDIYINMYKGYSSWISFFFSTDNNIISTRKREIFSVYLYILFILYWQQQWSFKASRALLYITFNKHMLPTSQ